MSLFSNVHHAILDTYLNVMNRKRLGNLYKNYTKELELKPLSKQQEQEIVEYWFNLTGKKVPTRWHQLLYSLTGLYQKEWMPFEICREIQLKLSPLDKQVYFDDKNFYRYFLKDFNLSKRYVECSNGTWMKIENDKAIASNRNECSAILSDIGFCVIKPSIGTDGGNGVRLLDMHNGVDLKTGDSVDKILQEYFPNFLVEDRIEECENLSNLNPDSCNTMRVHTWRNHEKQCIEFISAYMRIGKKGTIKDNMYSGGMGVMVYPDGTLKHGVSCYPFKKYDITDAGTRLNGYKIEDFEKIKETALRAHANLSMFDLCGWDMTVNKTGEVVIVEFNPNPDVRLEQEIFGTSCYMELTEEVCKQVFAKK